MKKIKLSKPMLFILLFGVVSLFSDMTHEGAASIRGAYMAMLGASAGIIGFVSGLGELVGYSLRYVFGKITDKKKNYWSMTLIGYCIDIIAVPTLTLSSRNGWVFASILLLIQRMGKAIKKPAKDTILSFVATQEGAGKSFGIQELLDQIGAFLGPVFLYIAMLFKTDGDNFKIYSTCFAFLAIPAAITLILLIYTMQKFPNPENFEPEPKEYIPFKMNKEFAFYIAGISFFAFGFMDYSLIVMHISKLAIINNTSSIINQDTIPLLYAMAMLIDAISAIFFGIIFDKKGVKSLIISTLLSAPFAYFIFLKNSYLHIFTGITMWGIGMGAQESILKASVSKMVPKSSRATGYGIFEFSFGIFWFLGSWLLGILYDINILIMVFISILSQLSAIPFYIKSSNYNNKLH